MTKLEQLRDDINMAEQQHQKWHHVWCFGAEEMYGKSREEVIALVNYFEGKYDGLCNALRYMED